MDDDEHANLGNINDLLASLGSGNTIPYLEGVVKRINTLKDSANETRNAPIMGKKIAEYPYYAEIQEQFLEIYKDINEFDVLSAFGFDTQEINNLEKIKSEPIEQRKQDAIGVLQKMGLEISKINFDDPSSISNEILGQLGKKMMADPSLFKKAKAGIYFGEITDMIKTLKEYGEVLVDLNKVDTSKPIERLIAKSLYEKAYENNKKVVINAYETTTHNKVDVNKPEDMQAMSNYMRQNYPSLMVDMENRARVDVAHSKYGNIDNLTSDQLFQMATRNLITSIVGLLAKTDNLAVTLENDFGILKKIGFQARP